MSYTRGILSKLKMCIVLFLLFPIVGRCQAHGRITSGYSDEMAPVFVAYDSVSNNITGYIDMHSIEPKNKFVCHLFFKGKMSNSKKIPLTFYPSFTDIKQKETGWIIINTKNEMILGTDKMISSPCDHQINLVEGESIKITKEKPFKKISLIKVDKQYLYKSNNFNSKQKSYIVYCDAVGIIKEDGDWLFISYLENEKIKAWIPRSSVLDI